MRLFGLGPKRNTPTPPPPPAPPASHAGTSTPAAPASSTPSRAPSTSQGPVSDSGRPSGPQTFEEMGLERVPPKKWNKPSTWNNIEGALRAPASSAPPSRRGTVSQGDPAAGGPGISLPPPHRTAWDLDLTGAATTLPRPDHATNPAPQDRLNQAREDLRRRTGVNPPAPPTHPPHHQGGNQDYGLEYYGI